MASIDKRGKSLRIVFRNKGERKAHRLNLGVVSDREARALAWTTSSPDSRRPTSRSSSTPASC